MHLRLDMLAKLPGHPQEIMRNLGITYSRATPQSVSDGWLFWNCINVPKVLPRFIKMLPVGQGFNDDVYSFVGHGISQKMAEDIDFLEKKIESPKRATTAENLAELSIRAESKRRAVFNDFGFGGKRMQMRIGKLEALAEEKEDIESRIENFSQRFPFYAAMEKMHQHDSTLRRACWDTGKFIEKAVDIADKNGLGVFIVICLPNSDGMGSRRAPWLPTPADLFAKDWMIF